MIMDDPLLFSSSDMGFGEEAMLMMIYGVVVHHYHCAKLIDGLGITGMHGLYG
jgi:hypothetical protein